MSEYQAGARVGKWKESGPLELVRSHLAGPAPLPWFLALVYARHWRRGESRRLVTAVSSALLEDVQRVLLTKRKWWILCLLVAAIVMAFASLFPFEEPWHTLPDGTRIRLETIAYAREVKFKDRGLELSALRRALGPKWGRLLGPKPESTSFSRAQESLFIVFRTEGAGGRDSLNDAECKIALPDGDFLRLKIFGIRTHPESGDLHIASFYRMPQNAADNVPRLEMDLTVQNKTIHFSKANPAFKRGAK